MFRFTSIPCGTYKLVPFYNCENTVFDVSPPSLLVPAEHDHAIVPQRFQVTGFYVGGRVVDGNGVGVYHAKIIVDGHERSITDKEGYYMLDQVTSKRYSIEAKKQHYKFEKLSDFLDIFVRLQIWNLVVSVFGFSSTTELVFGIYLLYYFRVFDRQIGYNKYTIDKAPGSGVLQVLMHKLKFVTTYTNEHRAAYN